LLDSFEGLLEREIIQADLEKKNTDLLLAYAQDLKQIQEIFVKFKDSPPVNNNLPPRSGAVTWVRGLVERVEDPMVRLKMMSKSVLETEEGKDAVRFYTAIMESLKEFELTQVSEWALEIENSSQEKLKQSLLRTDEDQSQYIRVNFDPALVCLLREVKYFVILKISVPESASQVYQKAETFRQQTGNLDLIVNIYNKMLETLLPVERPLLQSKLEAIDKILQRGLTQLNWKSHSINEFISNAMTVVKESSAVLQTIKKNVSDLEKQFQVWCEVPLMDRKSAKTYTIEEFQATMSALVVAKYKDIEEKDEKLHEMLASSCRVLKVNKGAPAWKSYVDYVNQILIDGLINMVVTSARYLRNQIDPAQIQANDISPLLEIKLALVGNDASFSPELFYTANHDGLLDLITSWFGTFINTSTFIKRLDTGDGDYLFDVQDDPKVRYWTSSVFNFVEDSLSECAKFAELFQKFSFLWTESISASFAAFMQEQTPEGKSHPPLSAFEKELQKYSALDHEAKELPVSKTIGWLKIDARPIKQSVCTWVSKWAMSYKSYLQNKAQKDLSELQKFVESNSNFMDTEVQDNSRNALLVVMGSMRDVRVKMEEIDEGFDPLRKIVEMLKKNGVESPPDVLEKLETLPLAWTNLKKKAVVTKEKHGKSQSDEADNVKKQVKGFEQRLETFVAHYKSNMPYNFTEDYEQAYKTLDLCHHGEDPNGQPSLVVMIKETKALNELEQLFELNETLARELKVCLREGVALKHVWDMVQFVVLQYAEWKKIRWDDIDVDLLQNLNKVTIKDVKQMDKSVKNLGVYKGLEDMVKNMQITLPLVEELHHPAMRDRHWKQLMKAMAVSFTMDANFTLGDLIALKPFEFVDDVGEIVDRAQKELIIEKQLKKIEDVWRNLDIQFVIWEEGNELQLLFVPEEVSEALEENQVQMQNLMASKYVQNNSDFLAIVSGWQQKLGNVDSCLQSWMEVQKKWQNLQSIFVGSADIRIQLPEDSKRFDGIDATWKELMKEALLTVNTVEACNLEGRIEKIEEMLGGLEKCEKALADYLETKRVAYPRFYFVASADLLDILSKGSNPHAILNHLPKCFDNVKTLEFDLDKDGNKTKKSIGMYSGEMEYVPFHEKFSCDGAVEKYLYDLTEHTHYCMKHVLAAATRVMEEKPREQFLFDWSAQIVVVVFRIAYTEEVNIAFDSLEEGNENAMKDFSKKQVDDLTRLTGLVLVDQTDNDRKKIITIITIDVHARDVVTGLIDSKAEAATCFAWNSQLRFTVDEKSTLTRVMLLDYERNYGYEYVGNCGCLVVTPLTDRCYITLCQAQRLIMGGAPAGPAGTGKTETVKDLGRGTGNMVYVFNCSDQMDYKSMGQIYKGLASSGSWGCFDEFNRIDVAVLSVVSTQLKCVLDAVKNKKTKFNFEDDEVAMKLDPVCFPNITMNPGYAGRTELPESVKALFRPCAMIVPDMDMITEIMLMSEGFAEGKILSRKFMILYRLNEALLSQSKHYDWKLRAVKTTLNVAGAMRRQDRSMSEDRVLLRALRDFNLGKLIADDVGIFMGLLNDLFPKTLEFVPRARNDKFEDMVKKSAQDFSLQPDEVFCLKVSQLKELLGVRWSVFILGPAGCGKSEMIRTLVKTHANLGEKNTTQTLNPKSVTRNELYGYIHPATREWKDGLISQIFRDLANTHTVPHEYIILDGDIDPEWIESMNTVMDDNKMLTLASNERIPLTKPMRLLFEIENLREASPATVSRAGIIFMNDTDVGWAPFMQSWIDSREFESERAMLSANFEFYALKCLDFRKRNTKSVVPLPEINIIQSVIRLLEGLIGNGERVQQNCKMLSPEESTKYFEAVFCYCMIWGLGGALVVDAQNDYRSIMDKWWREEWKNVKIPEAGTIFDYCVDVDTGVFKPWTDISPAYIPIPETLFGNIYVPTVETTRLTYNLSILMVGKYPVIFVGGAGTGKTTIMKDKLHSLDPELFSTLSMNLNCYTDSLGMQTAMESVLEKKTGRTFGPQGSRKLIYFIDDLNMPQVDKYGTQQPIALLRQLLDYMSWYDRQKLTLREIQNVSLLSCFNPTAGSFKIDPRLQRQYCTFAVQMPSSENLVIIYKSIFMGHVSNFDPDVQTFAERVVTASLELHRHVTAYFLPTAVKFHYQFNLRQLASVFEGLTRSKRDYFTQPLSLARLWVNEVERVYMDRLTTDADMTRFGEMVVDVCKKNMDNCGFSFDKLYARPIQFTTFASPNSGAEAPPYMEAQDAAKVKKAIEDKLFEYNETNAVMNIVLFDQAIEHVCRICRIIDLPRGNALLVGVGGSGKQSLARLSAFICGYESFQITITNNYTLADFKLDLVTIYQKSGIKNVGICFIFVDGQIVNEKMLVFMNDMLASGKIADLFTPEERDDAINGVRSEVKQAGIVDSNENCFDFYIEKTRKNLHTCLCFSPVGDKFRIRARQFPALTACTTIDWFHPWPHEALIQVAQRFLIDIPNMEPEIKEGIAQHMAFVHGKVNDASIAYLESDRRYNYTTPKSFLDLIDLYKTMLARKIADIGVLKVRLENGVEKIANASAQVAELQENLIVDLKIVEEKKAATDTILVQVGQETNIAEEQKAGAAIEEARCAAIAAEVTAFQAECKHDLMAAEPIIAEAMAALNSLDKKSLTELKSLATPPPDVVTVLAAVMILTSGGTIPKDLSWNTAKKEMASVDKFLEKLVTFDKDNTPENCVAHLEKNYLSVEGFTPANIKSKSSAAAGMCAWVINICKYFRIYQVVEPKRLKLGEANAKYEQAMKELGIIRAKVAELEARLAKLTALFENATTEKNEAIATAEKTKQRANMADRLVNGLSDENARWIKTLELFGIQERKLIGDVMVSSSLVSYVGAFSIAYRTSLVIEQWIPDIIERQIPMTEGVNPMNVLANEAQIASWNNENLPSDTVSIQNGAIITNCKRWPLMIDPQLQGIKWIRTKEAKNNLKVTQQTTHRYLDTVELCIQNGEPLMLENLGESIDAVLEPVLSRAVIRRGRSFVLKLGDKEVDYDPNFKLYIQTKLANPHYKPEVAAQTTLINFMITLDGLEEQLLAIVVNKERPDLEAQKTALLEKQNNFKIQLKGLEDDILMRLSSSQGDILADVELIEALETTKKTAKEIEEQVKLAKITEVEISVAREVYRPVGIRGSLLYFLVDSLWILDHMYRFSMANFVKIFIKGMFQADEPDKEEKRSIRRKADEDDDGDMKLGGGGSEIAVKIDRLIKFSCFCVYDYVSQCLFERHKIIFATQLTLEILRKKNEIDPALQSFLIRNPKVTGIDNAMAEWLADPAWQSVQALREHEPFQSIVQDIEGSAKRFKEWYDLERPEEAALPGEMKKLSPFHRLIVIRCLRPDRCTDALRFFVAKCIGEDYVGGATVNLGKAYQDMTPGIPMFFILSPGVDPVKEVETYGRQFNMTTEAGKFSLVSLGQGQEPVAVKALDAAHKSGGWVFLMNIHLTKVWTSKYLEKRIDKIAEGAHEDFRLFLSAEPDNEMPVNILQACIKITNEPPEGLAQNQSKAYSMFTNEFFENCSKPAELRQIVFSLTFFHAIIFQRKKFGPQGWNRQYPFNNGDLWSSAQVAVNYLEANPKIPWDDLRYIFGEIMYGGHITDDWDRKLCSTYLKTYMNEYLLEGLEFFPGYAGAPPTANTQQAMDYIFASMPPENPVAFGMHLNAEIGFRLQQADFIFQNVLNLQPRTAGGAGGLSLQDKAKMVLDEIMEKLPESFDLFALTEKLEERSPFTNVFLQEMERMNMLLFEMRRSLAELDLGLKGDLQISAPMEELMQALFLDKVPNKWEALAWPSMRSLAMWLLNHQERNKQLQEVSGDLSLPKVTWLSGLFNPQSFLTAVMQSTARKNDWPLDKIVIQTELTKNKAEEITSVSKEGAYVNGLSIEGARWDDKSGALDDSKPKELFATLPVIQIKAVTVDKAEVKDSYLCPVYKTQQRGHTYVFTANLRSKQQVSKWILAGVGILMDVVQ